MARTVLILCIAAAGLAAKDRAWQPGQLLDNHRNPYFRTALASADDGGLSSSGGTTFGPGDNGALVVKPRGADGNLSYDDYVIASADTVYLVEYAHFKNFPSANISLAKPLNFAIEKNKLIILDLDRREFETTILKQTDKAGHSAPAQVEQAKAEPPKSEKPKPQAAKPDVFATAALTTEEINPPRPKPAPPTPPPPPLVQTAKPPAPKPEPNAQAAVTKPAPKPQPDASKPVVAAVKPATPAIKPAAPALNPAPKPEPKVEAAATRPPQRPQPEGPVARASTKDRAWQSGQLLSVANNNFFFNVTYTQRHGRIRLALFAGQRRPLYRDRPDRH